MAAIHHATAALAARLGVTLEVFDGEVVATFNEFTASGPTGKAALDKLQTQMDSADDADEEEAADEELAQEAADEMDAEEAGEEEAGESRSIVKAKYKNREPDELASKISAAVRVQVVVGKRKVWRIDAAKLQRLAEANGAWRPEYAALNPGQQRMNCGNRLRALVKSGKKVKWS